MKPLPHLLRPVILLGLGVFASLVASGTAPDDRPNIIVIMSDDHAYQAISAYGHELNHTPHIDRLAREGALFTRASVTNSICAPSRAVMLTGQHSFKNGKVDNQQAFDWSQANFAKYLQQAGYGTALVGKIHLGGTPTGFDYTNVLPGQGHYYNPDFIVNGERRQFPGYVTTLTTQFALDWLQTGRDPQKPFLLLYHQKAPHRAWMPEPKYFSLYENRSFDLPSNFFDSYEGRPAAANHEMGIWADLDLVYDLKMLDPAGELQTGYRNLFMNHYGRMDSAQKAAWDAHYLPLIEAYKASPPTGRELAQWKFDRYMQDYLSCIQSVDDGVGELLDFLDESGLTEDTIVVYTSDQGFYLGEHGWFDKRFMYEESFRTPLLVRYPREIAPGQKLDQLVQNLDLAPTFLDYAKVAIPSDMQGASFRAVTSGEDLTFRDHAYYTYYEYPAEHSVMRHYGLRTDRYKLIHFYHDLDYWELYDLEEDPQEMNNLYGKPEYREIQSRLHKKLETVRQNYGDSDELNAEHLARYLEFRKSRQ